MLPLFSSISTQRPRLELMINTWRVQLAHVESKQYLAKCKMSVDLHKMWVSLEDKQEKK